MARTDFEPLTWEEAEQNRREALIEDFAAIPEEEFPITASLLHAARQQPASPVAPSSRTLSESPCERRERLRGEVKRGREYIDQAKKDLAESRARLEAWPTYERICGRNPLAHLTKSVLINERIAHYLVGWLERREAELNALARHGTMPAALPTPPARRVRRRSTARKEFLHQRSSKSRLVA